MVHSEIWYIGGSKGHIRYHKSAQTQRRTVYFLQLLHFYFAIRLGCPDINGVVAEMTELVYMYEGFLCGCT